MHFAEMWLVFIRVSLFKQVYLKHTVEKYNKANLSECAYQL